MRKRQITSWIGLAAATSIMACTDGMTGALRRHTYPPPFNYVTREQLKSAMWRLAGDTYELDALLRRSSGPPAASQQRVVALLADMGDAASSLGPAGWPSNHPKIGENVDRLRQDIQSARQAAERKPPNYFYAGAVSGACLYCHAAGPRTPHQ